MFRKGSTGTTGSALSSTGLLAEGWHPATEMPDTDRHVQIAWDDGSTGENAIGFVDEISQIPPTGKRLWWQFRRGFGFWPLRDGDVMAWRELDSANNRET